MQIGPKTALNLVQKHGCMEKVLESLDKDKYPIPDPFPYQEARRLFKGAPATTWGTMPWPRKDYVQIGRSF